MKTNHEKCPVCRTCAAGVFQQVEAKLYLRCAHCEATFLDKAHLPSREEEQGHYAHHENDVDDPGYRSFLARLAEPMRQRIPAGAEGLDYGCGPGPALAVMMEEAGHRMRLYDPIFRDDPPVFDARYDFITCTETAEHFHRPAAEFDRLDGLLRPGGVLGVMTCFQTDDEKFADWRYRADPTHVVFYRPRTFEVLAEQRGWRLEIPCKDIAICRKGS